MFAVADVGNTTVKVAIINSNTPVETITFSLDERPIPSIKSLLVKYRIKMTAVCSVNPIFSSKFDHEMDAEDIAIHYIDYSNIPLKNRYSPPKEVGSDRLVIAYAIWKKYGSNAIVVDMGTAITFEMITDDGEYRGGLIFPGISLLTESLYEKTALLPKVLLMEKAYPVIGENTNDAVAGGIYHGISVIVPGIVEKIKNGFGNKMKVFITGGDSESFKHRFPSEWEYVPNIIIEGLIMLCKELSLE